MKFLPTSIVLSLIVFSFMLAPDIVNAQDYQWPPQTVDAAAPAAQAVPVPDPNFKPTAARPNPRAKLTLEGCLQSARMAHGALDDNAPQIKECYRSWAGTQDSSIRSFQIVRSTVGPAPCYPRQKVILRDDGTMSIQVDPNDQVRDCPNRIRQQKLSFKMSPVNVEYLRSLLGMKILTEAQSQYVDASMNPATKSVWTFTLNNQPFKAIQINLSDEGSLPDDLKAYLNSFDSTIVQTQKR